MTETVEDFVDVVAALKAEGCEFLVVGAHALAAHGSPRATGDLDIFVRPSTENADRVSERSCVVHGHLGGERVPFIGLDAMLKNKRASGRTKDLADAEVLEELGRRRRKPPPT